MFFFFNDTATTEIYTLSLHDALPISKDRPPWRVEGERPGSPQSGPAKPGRRRPSFWVLVAGMFLGNWFLSGSGEPKAELQSRQYLVCRLLLEKKKTLHSPFLLCSLDL